MWELHRLLKSIISDKGPQFVTDFIKKLNSMLKIEIRLLMAFYLQIDRQIEQINQELEQYLRFFTKYIQKDQLEWLAIAEFAVNNKVHLAMDILPFMTNYSRELRIGADIRRKGKMEKVTELAERMRKVQEKARIVLRKVQEEMKRQTDRECKKAEEWKRGDKVMLSMKDLVFEIEASIEVDREI